MKQQTHSPNSPSEDANARQADTGVLDSLLGIVRNVFRSPSKAPPPAILPSVAMDPVESKYGRVTPTTDGGALKPAEVALTAPIGVPTLRMKRRGSVLVQEE